MSIKRSYLVTTAVSLLIGLTLSCQKSNDVLDQKTEASSTRVGSVASSQAAIQSDDYELSNGALHFKDLNAFVRVHKFLATKTNDERIKFAEAAGFKSLLTYQRDVIKSLEAADVARDLVSFKGLLGNYADIITVDQENTLLFKIKNPLLAAYQNRSGIVYIGKALYKFEDKEQTIVLDGDPAKIDSPESSVVKHIVHRMNVSAAPGGKIRSICRYFEDKIIYGNCGDRYSRLSVVAQMQNIQQDNGKWMTVLTPYALAFPFKKNFWGWVHYSTNNDMFVNWTFSAYTTEPGQPNGPSNPIYSFGNRVFSNYDSNIQFSGDVATFSNLYNSSGGSVNWQFEFPTDSGWHRMVCVQNDMSCP